MPTPQPDDAAADRLTIHNLLRRDLSASFREDVRAGLTARPKKLFPKYFYDELGSQLFEAICLLPEYYLTRAENEILARYADEIVGAVEGQKVTLLELGSGSASKTRRIIEALIRYQNNLLYTPIDISASALETSSRVLLQSYPELRIEAYVSDYFEGLAALKAQDRPLRTLALFLGSNIGNFDPAEAKEFLRAVRGVLRAGDALLLGADLKKNPQTLEAAYDDAMGVTASFNLNQLARINRELNADFNLRAFHHHVSYNEEAGRVEVYIVSLRNQRVRVPALSLEIHLDEGERIHTENSHKYDLDGLTSLANETGFERARTWLDAREQFSSNLFLVTSKG
ncbi:MAG TPA: L-histidine N(alpha)-methyltransferase [Pyrinomonadaceae bacterium]|nr:L-histidine N(alpha)-methyltransferase [Pyrinomonadaceae bacterium]